MLLVDDIAFFPVKSILSLFREIYKAAVQEIADEADSLRAELGQLYQMLESGAIDEAAFDAREGQILDRLDAIEARDLEAEGEEDESDEDDDDDESDDDESDDDESDDDENEEDEDEDEDEESLEDEAA